MALSARDIAEIEREHPDGLSSKQILELLGGHGEPITEATLRKYVQLGLLPRSRRVGEKGKHRGSRGIYPVEVIRRIDEIRRLMSEGDTLESLQKKTAVIRARLAATRVAIEEVLEAAEVDLETRSLDRGAKLELRSDLGARAREAKNWLRAMEKWASDIEGPPPSAKKGRADKGDRKEESSKRSAKRNRRSPARAATSGRDRLASAGATASPARAPSSGRDRLASAGATASPARAPSSGRDRLASAGATASPARAPKSGGV